MLRILHVFVFFSRTIARNGTKFSVLTIESLLSKSVFSDFQNYAQMQSSYTLYPRDPRLDEILNFFGSEESPSNFEYDPVIIFLGTRMEISKKNSKNGHFLQICRERSSKRIVSAITA